MTPSLSMSHEPSGAQDEPGLVIVPLMADDLPILYSPRRGIAITRDPGAAEPYATDAGRRSDGLTLQRPVAVMTVAVF